MKQSGCATMPRCPTIPPWLQSPACRSGRPEGFVNAWLESTQTYAIKLVLVPLLLVTKHL